MKNSEDLIKFGDRRHITGVFLDIVNFTEFCENLDPEEVDDIVNLYFDLFANIIERNGGWIEKYIGDAIFAVFGKDIASTLDPYKACISSIEIIEACKNLNKNSNYSINIRIGIHSGLVAKSKRGQYEVLVGDTVNTTSRIQHLADNNEILISSEVNESITEYFYTKFKGIFEVKGKKEKLYLYSLKGIKKDYDKIIPDESIFKRKQLKEFLKFYLTNKFPITINGEKKSGKTYFIYSIYHILKELKKKDIIFISFNPIEKITINSLTNKLIMEISHRYQKLNNLLNLDEFQYVKSQHNILEILDILQNLIILIDNFETYSDKIYELFNSKKFLEMLKFKNIFLIISSTKFKYKNNIQLSKMDYEECIMFINFVLKQNIALSVENKLISLSSGNIGILTELLTIYKNQKKIDFSLNIENIYLEIIDQLDNASKIILYTISLAFSEISKSVLFKIVLNFKQIDHQQFDNIINNLLKLNLIQLYNSKLSIHSYIIKKIINNSILKKNKKLIYKKLFEIEGNKLIKFFYAKSADIEYDINFCEIKNNVSPLEIIEIINILLKEKNYDSNFKKFISEVSSLFYSISLLTQYKIEIDFEKFLSVSQNYKLNLLVDFLNGKTIKEGKDIYSNIESPDFILLFKFLKQFNEFKKISSIYIEFDIKNNYNKINYNNDFFNLNAIHHELVYSLSCFQKIKYLSKITENINLNDSKFKLKISRFFILCSRILLLINTNFIKKYKEIIIILNKLEKLAFDIDFKVFYEIYYFYLFLFMFITGKYEFVKYFEDFNNNIIFFKDEYKFLNILNKTIFNDINSTKNINNVSAEYQKDKNLLKNIISSLSIQKIKLLPIHITIYLLLIYINPFKYKTDFDTIFKNLYIEYEKEILEIKITQNTFTEKVIDSLSKIFKSLI